MVGDLFHFGHVRLFERAALLGDELVVGLHSDAVVASYKRLPVLSLDERVAVISAIMAAENTERASQQLLQALLPPVD